MAVSEKYRDKEQDQLLCPAAAVAHQSSRGLNRGSNESDRKGEVHCKYDALAAEQIIWAGLRSLYNARATDALATERWRAQLSKFSCGQRRCTQMKNRNKIEVAETNAARRQPGTTHTYVEPAAEAPERTWVKARNDKQQPGMTRTYVEPVAEAPEQTQVTACNRKRTRPAKQQKAQPTQRNRFWQRSLNGTVQRSLSANGAGYLGKSLPANDSLC